jgi:glycosyltransferase involved in cell wall biosynthesis
MEEAVGPGRLRLLMVVPFPIRLDGRHGGSRALAQLAAHLAARHTVALVVLRSDEEPGIDETLRQACALVEEVPIPEAKTIGARVLGRIRLRVALLRGTPTWAAVRTAPGFRRRLEEVARAFRPDVVQLEYRIAGATLPLSGCSAPTVLVEHDPVGPSDRCSWLRDRLERRAWRALGRAAFAAADAIVVFTERDRREVAELSQSTPVAHIPLGYELPDPPASPTGGDPPTILFVASFIHAPNVDAAVWLARDISPAVLQQVPAASVELVGSHPSPEIRALARPGVTVSGDVADPWPYLDRAAVVVAPLRQGGGMRVKVLEALAAGKAVVATPLALEGLEVRPGEQVLVAETAAEFASALVELLADVERRRAVAVAARQWAEEHLDVETQVRAYEALFERLLLRRELRRPIT